MIITYGTKDYNIDVTDICKKQLNIGNIITIPSGDQNRSKYFSDPIDGTQKKIFITIECNEDDVLKINLIDKNITTFNLDKEISKLHSIIKIKHGDFKDELPEQKMVLMYLNGNEKVLELGSNIGRNSLIIAQILQKKKNYYNFVSLECDPIVCAQLIENRDLNGFRFHIENSALSKRNLIQKYWDTIVSDDLLDGYERVKNISFEQLKTKYRIDFDTLIIDCEGAFYYILQDMPELLDNINLIIMENDYVDLRHKEFVDNILRQNNFYVDYVKHGGWGPCYKFFYEVWKKS